MLCSTPRAVKTINSVFVIAVFTPCMQKLAAHRCIRPARSLSCSRNSLTAERQPSSSKMR